MKPTKATFTLDNSTDPIDLPVLTGSLGPNVVDIRNLAGHGYFTYDPGFL
ncbi:MAG: citrate (Si)-synthase, partial [Methylophilaceae bacterium]